LPYVQRPPSRTGYYLTHQAIKLVTHSSTASPNAGGIFGQALKVKLRYLMKQLKCHGPPSLLHAPMVSSLLLVDRKREDLGLVYRQFCRICRNRAKVHSFSTATPAGITGVLLKGKPLFC
jgi:hypothetical protein